MSDTTAIQWTDATWNPVTGCTRVSEGCRNCYAERLTATRLRQQPKYRGLARRDAAGGTHWNNIIHLHPEELERPFKWRKPRRVFVCSMSDLFHPDVPLSFIAEVFTTMAQTTQHTYQVLTKRPERLAEFYAWNYRGPHAEGAEGAIDWLTSWPNVWLGTSVEDQAAADARIPHLLSVPAAIRFLSVEPMLSPVSIADWLLRHCSAAWWEVERIIDEDGRPPLHWVICGGESGFGARPMPLTWPRALLAECRRADVPFFMKQLSAADTPTPEYRTFECFPPDLRVRQYPEVTS